MIPPTAIYLTLAYEAAAKKANYMSQRDSGYARKERDLYETPEWVTLALLPHLPDYIAEIWEPACGSKKMVRAIKAACPSVHVWSSDVAPLDERRTLKIDFLNPCVTLGQQFDAIVTNPPYETAQAFIEIALERAEDQEAIVAMLLRTDFDHAKSRSHLFRDCPVFAKKLVLTKRIVWFDPEPGAKGKSPSFNHAWFIWDWNHKGPPTIAYGP